MPCNQFGDQEPKGNHDIHKFAKEKYHVKFPMFEKEDVNGEKASDMYLYLRARSSLMDKHEAKIGDIPWNFGKFLVDSHGKVVDWYLPAVQPEDVLPDIRRLLHAWAMIAMRWTNVIVGMKMPY